MRISPYRSSQCGSNPRVTARKARIYAAANSNFQRQLCNE